MRKNFPKSLKSLILKGMEITTLDKFPDLFPQTLELISKSFEYKKPNRFEIDFYPLINRGNWKNCYILHDKKNVIAHIGVKPHLLGDLETQISIAMYGGICVDKNQRGKGYFSKLLTHVLEHTKEVSIVMLWSGDHSLYQKFGFSLNFEQFEFFPSNKRKSGFKKDFISNLSSEDLLNLKQLYRSRLESQISVIRSNSYWQELFKISSSDLYLKRNSSNKIQSYFFMNKGQDLQNIIHEFFYHSEQDLKEMQAYGIIWGGFSEKDILKKSLANSFLSTLIKVNDQDAALKILKHKNPVFISGLDSI